MRKAYKSIISLAVVLIAVLNLIVPAFAQDPFTQIAIGGISGLSGAGLFGSMASMSGIDISWTGSTSDPMDAMWNVLNPDHVYFSGEKHEASGTGEDIWDYITVDIGDWLEAQSDFIVQLVNDKNIEDNDSGEIVTNSSYKGYPFNNGGIGPSIGNASTGTFTVSDLNLVLTDDGNRWKSTVYRNNTIISNEINVYKSGLSGRPIYLQKVNDSAFRFIGYNSAGTVYNFSNLMNLSSTPSSVVEWSSNIVNTHVFDGWESAKVKIPSDSGVLPVNWDIPDFVNAINELWINNQQGQIVIEDTDQPVPPPPIPDTPLGEVPFDGWVDLWGQGIYQQLENQSDALDLIGSNGEDAIEDLESIDSNLDDLNQTAESIDTNIGIGNGILGGIRSLAQSAVNYLEGIAEHVEELVEEIVEGTETLIAGILNQIPQAFGIIFGPIKQASSIWHYVVEWIQSIGAPFQFIWSMASGTSYYIILPVYASLAAAVVLAFYKRFGK